jgi:hypothetical protein
LLGQYRLLMDRLVACRGYEVSQREYAIRVCGHRPEELFIDKYVFDLNRNYFASMRGPGGVTADGAGNALQYDMPEDMTYTEFVRRLEPLVKDMPAAGEGQARVKEWLQVEIDRLTERKTLVALVKRESSRPRSARPNRRSTLRVITDSAISPAAIESTLPRFGRSRP